MSEENVEVVRRLFPGRVDFVQALDPDGFETTRAAMEPLGQPEFEGVTVPGQVPVPGAGGDPSRPIAYGLDGFARAFRDWLSAWDTWVVTAPDFIDVNENRVLALFDVRARSKTHQVEMPIEGATLITVTKSRVTRLELVFDREQALKAAGLSE